MREVAPKNMVALVTAIPLWPGDAIWQHRSGLPFTQVIACCLTAPSHYLTQCWLIINEVLWHSSEIKFTENTHDSNLQDEFEYYNFKILLHLPGVNELITDDIAIAKYRQVSNIRHTLVGNKIVDHSDVVGASPVSAAPTTSSFST